MSKFEEKWYDPLLKFATHIIVGIVLFSAIAFSAFLLHLLVHWMEEHNLEAILVLILRWLTYFVMGIDIIVFVVYSLHEMRKFLQEILT
jgi:predicted phosphoadenosine phosphosulfate sulfurtransferase